MQKGKLFSFLFRGYFGSYGFLSFVFGVFSLCGVMPANLNGTSYYGITGFFITILFAPLFALIFAATSWIFIAPGLIVYDFFADVFQNLRRSS
ncbi:hypothetical protein [Hymenobacter lapidiphilus]|uniref:Uncharacterized protein n=1 Tax=Hymenobacter lapidiphilus TaxID=2608003 RepID=A0A7Y7U4X2_9BACT|nr:hypothetical protein [Hymenobacter lapidiphilus]NVO30717.1 hypothetical protein [Hymenobacter lapidiphilus]